MSGVLLRDDVAESSSDKGPRHLREGEQQQRPPTKGVDGPDGRPGEDEVDQAETERREQRARVAGTSLRKHRRAVEGNDVDCRMTGSARSRTPRDISRLTSAQLLGQHDSERSEGSATDTRDREELEEASHIVAAVLDKFRFDAQLGVDVEEIASGLQLGVAEALERLVRLGVLALLDVPAGRFCEHSIISCEDWQGYGVEHVQIKCDSPGQK